MLSSSALQRAWARGQADMAKKCEITGKKPMVGHNVSHSQRRTKRRWLPNLRTVTVLDENGNKTKMKVTIYDHYIAIDWSIKNMAIARMTKKSNKITAIDVPSDIEDLQTYLKNMVHPANAEVAS